MQQPVGERFDNCVEPAHTVPVRAYNGVNLPCNLCIFSVKGKAGGLLGSNGSTVFCKVNVKPDVDFISLMDGGNSQNLRFVNKHMLESEPSGYNCPSANCSESNVIPIIHWRDYTGHGDRKNTFNSNGDSIGEDAWS